MEEYMRIAISADDSRGLDSVAAHHFGRCPYYVFVDVEERKVQKVETLPNPTYEHHTPGAVPAFIHAQGADVMLAGGMGRRAIDLFQQYGIRAHTGAAGTARRALEQFLGGALEEAVPCKEHSGGGEHEHQHAADHDEEEHGEVQRLQEEITALHKQIVEAGNRLEQLQ